MAAKPPSSPAESIHRQLESLCNSYESIPWETPRRFTSYAARLHRITGNLLRLSPEILSSPTVHTALRGISGDLVKAVETVSVYRERSKIFVLINCRSLCSSLQDRTAAIGGWLALLETGLKDVTDVRKKVSDLSRDMKQAQFSVTENEMRVYSTLQTEGQGRPIAKPVQSAIIMDLARALGIDPTNHAELLEHVKLLKNDLARSNSVSERRILMSLQRIIDSCSAEPNISALSLDFDIEDESQILPFKNFICPLTKEVMKDPVVLESAQTYERTAIEYWFQRCLEDGRDPTCPVTGQVLRSLEQKPNIGLAGAIEEWVNRNVDIHIKSAVKHLSKDPPSMDFVERVLDSIYKISEEHPSSRYKIRNASVILLIMNLLKNCSKSISSPLKSKALMALLSMAKDEDSKMIMIREGVTKLAIKSLAGSTEKEKEKENALRLLIEFTDNEAYCAKIASEKGAFLLLSSMAENLECPTLSNIAEDVLKRLEVIDENVENSAAAGRFEPLLSRLCEGSRDIQIEMASLLGKMTLTNCSKEQIANRSAKVLVEMLHKPETRTASLHALCNLSSSDDNATILVEASVLPAVTDIILESHNILSEQKELAAAIIANIVTNPGHWELAEVNKDGHLMLSSFVVSHLMLLLPQVTPQCQVSILRILCGIASSPKACDQVATEIKSGDGIKSIMEYLEHPETQHRIYALKLMRILSESSGGDFFDQLRLLNKVVLLKEKVLDNQSTNSERSDAACILANFTLSGDEVRTILGAAFLKWTVTTLKEIQHTPNGRTSRSSSSMLEGLLGLLLHFARNTNAQTLAWVKEHHLIAIFREQLSYLLHPRCKHLAVLGLKHLSESGKVLVSDGESDPLPPQGFCSSMVFMCGRLSPELSSCPIHNAPCEEDSELCLLKSNCIKPLVDLLVDEHTDVQIASVEALSSLIPDTFYSFRRAADELDRLGVADAVVALFINVRPGELQEKAIWMVERLLRGESTSQRFALNQTLVRALGEALKHGNANTRKIAQDALTNLKQLSGASGKISGPLRPWR
ncbi:U-box domain-containing protein 44-like [Chenopodium quinoa]|uniref:RING-type E3 ubiquitin transferase n=1 Tax=Chenopodium quinoa TaxID=63459 RepID=A0A803LXE8_CHEQI|nr:U-box domain-containing protein 44-like [Chenopodium quinoa]